MDRDDHSAFTVDKVILHAPTQALRVYAHADIALDYVAYCEAVQILIDQVKALGDMPKEIYLQNRYESEEDIERFCIELMGERLSNLYNEKHVRFSHNSRSVVLTLLKRKAEMSEADATTLDEVATFIKGCYENIEVTFEEPKEVAITKTESKPRPAAPFKKAQSVSNGKFMPGVKRRTVFGEEFSAKKLDQISELSLESGRVSVMGWSLGLKSQATRQKNAFIMQLLLTDRNETILVKWMATPQEEKKAQNYLDAGAQVGVKGEVRFDARYTKDNIIWADMVTWFDLPSRQDNAEKKRVELHAHTKMSPDGLADAAELVKTAARFGHPAIAITDHGVVQAFPDAYMASVAAKKSGRDIKLIYGVEAYLACDFCYEGPKAGTEDFVVLDIETTGLDPKGDELIEIGAVKVLQGELGEVFQSFVKPLKPIPSEIVSLTGIDMSMVKDAPQAKQALASLKDFI